MIYHLELHLFILYNFTSKVSNVFKNCCIHYSLEWVGFNEFVTHILMLQGLGIVKNKRNIILLITCWMLVEVEYMAR